MHAIFSNNKDRYADVLNRANRPTVEVEEWGSNGKPYHLHLRPPQGERVDWFSAHNMRTDPFKWSIGYIMAVACDPIDPTEMEFTWNDREDFLAMDDPAVVIRVATECFQKIADHYAPLEPEAVKEPSSTETPPS